MLSEYILPVHVLLRPYSEFYSNFVRVESCLREQCQSICIECYRKHICVQLNSNPSIERHTIAIALTLETGIGEKNNRMSIFLFVSSAWWSDGCVRSFIVRVYVHIQFIDNSRLMEWQ